MLGLYEFQFMTALTAKLDSASSQRSGLSGTFFMGTTIAAIRRFNVSEILSSRPILIIKLLLLTMPRQTIQYHR
jgi:hypothetical protein